MASYSSSCTSYSHMFSAAFLVRGEPLRRDILYVSKRQNVGLLDSMLPKLWSDGGIPSCRRGASVLAAEL